MKQQTQTEAPKEYLQIKIQAIENGFVVMLPGRTFMAQNGQPIQEQPATHFAGTDFDSVCNKLKEFWPKTISG